MQSLADEKLTAAATVETLNSEELFTARGLPWSLGNLIRMFKNTAFDGYVSYRDPDKPPGRITAARDAEGNFIHGDYHRLPVPEIIPQHRVAAVRAALASRSWRKINGRTYFLSTRIFGICGGHFGGHLRTHRNDAVYECSRSSLKQCDCKSISADGVEAAVWQKVVEGLKDKVHMKNLAKEWMGFVPDRVETYQQRMKDLEAQIAHKKKSRKRKILTLLSAIEGDAEDEINQETVDELKEELKSQEAKLQDALDETRGWLTDAEMQVGKVNEILARAGRVGADLAGMTDEQKREVIALFGFEVHITGHVPGIVRAGKCVLERWFRENDVLIPVAPLTDAQWASLQHLVPDRTGKGSSHYVSRRRVLDCVFAKLRSGLAWSSLPAEQFPNPESLAKIGRKMLKGGELQAVLEALGEYEGVQVPPLWNLPPMRITSSSSWSTSRSPS